MPRLANITSQSPSDVTSFDKSTVDPLGGSAPVCMPQGPTAAPRRLLDRVRDEIRLRHYSIRTETAYVDWIRRFIVFHGKRHPDSLGAVQVQEFLSHLAVERSVAASTQNQAKSAILFLYREVLRIQLPWLDEIVAARSPNRLPVVLTPSEARALLLELNGTMWLVASLLYGTGMRLLEGLRLRVKDLEFERREILVRDGKGGKDRVTVLPENLLLPLKNHVLGIKVLHDKDLAAGFGTVWPPNALATKYPAAPRAGAGNGKAGRHCQALLAAHPSPFVCDATAPGGL